MIGLVETLQLLNLLNLEPVIRSELVDWTLLSWKCVSSAEGYLLLYHCVSGRLTYDVGCLGWFITTPYFIYDPLVTRLHVFDVTAHALKVLEQGIQIRWTIDLFLGGIHVI